MYLVFSAFPSRPTSELKQYRTRWYYCSMAEDSLVSLGKRKVFQNFFIFCWPCISSQILVNNQLDALVHVFIYLFIHLISLHVSNIKCSSSGDQIVLIHHLVWLVCVSDCLVCQSGIPSSHLHRLIIPDDVLIQFDLLMMSTWCLKHVERWNE